MYVLREGGRAVLLTEGFLDKNAAKTAHGLLRLSRKLEIVGVIDSNFSGRYADEIVPGSKKVKIYARLKEVIEEIGKPDFMVVGVATIGGKLPFSFREHIKEAIALGINILSGLHEYLSEDEEFARLAKERNVKILDVRKPKRIEEMNMFRNLAPQIGSVRIPVLGTDSCIGKRTTAWMIYEELNSMGVSTEFVATGQTGILQGAEYGVPLDSIKGDYMVGELEAEIYRAWIEKRPKVIVIEGQGSISHPAYVCGSRAILSASRPQGVVLQHAPKRKYRNFGADTLKLPLAPLEKEIKMIELFGDTKVIGITLNTENMSDSEISMYIEKYESEFSLPVDAPFKTGVKKICKKIVELI